MVHAGLAAYELPPNQSLDKIIDLLTDLRHWCDVHEIDFDNCLRLSAMHHDAEVNPDDIEQGRLDELAKGGDA